VVADRPYAVEPLFTRDPRHINELHVLMGMMVIRGIYERHEVTSLNHGIGFDTAAIELLLPTYRASLGLKGKICRNWVLNPHPTLVPAIEIGWVESVHCFGSEVGMADYVAARPDIFFTGRDGSMRSNRVLCQLAGQYGVELFIGSTLQIDADANSSTVTLGRLAGFGGAPNMGHDPRGRRHSSPAWLSLINADSPIVRGRKLVVQMSLTAFSLNNWFVTAHGEKYAPGEIFRQCRAWIWFARSCPILAFHGVRRAASDSKLRPAFALLPGRVTWIF
jgi:malonate decarboxylase alpha subunit